MYFFISKHINLLLILKKHAIENIYRTLLEPTSLDMIKTICAAFLIFFLVSGNTLVAQQSSKLIKLEDVTGSRKFAPKAIRGIRSMNDGEHYTMLDKESNVIKYKYSSGLPVDTLFAVKWVKNLGITYISEYEFSHDELRLTITTNEEPIYRHSFTADYFVFEVKTKTCQKISEIGKQQLATFSPIGDKIAFVRNNNLFVVDLKSGNESQITRDGKHNEIINGAPDWVYEEEFGFSKGFEWSPDGNKLAYMRFDESRVKMFTIPVYNELYPTNYTYKYPKAGEENSIVTIHVYDFASSKTTSMDIGSETDQYIPRIKWTSDPDKLCILRLNRLQNKIDVLINDAYSGKSSILYTETNKYYISEVKDNYITFLKDKKRFVIFSETDGFMHLYLYSINGKLGKQITKGNFEIADLLGINQTEGIIYYTSTESSPLERDVYSIKLDGSSKTKLSTKSGTNKAEFSTKFNYYINQCSDANNPSNYTLHDSKGKLIRILEDNAELKTRLRENNFATKTFIKIPSENGLELNGYIIKPVDFNPSKKYPLFMFVYGGPESQNVKNEFSSGDGWLQYLVQQGYIVACVDNRGTNARGETFKKCTYLQLGKLETEDQILSARYFASQPYIDGSRIGIFGWSYGGYMSSLCLTKGADLFKLGIAVAPVTNWRFYDSVYTERFMRTPQENASGYDDNSPINFADKMKGKFLLIHGSADDNVHLQNTMMFAEKLIQANKKFEMAIYPDKNHSIYGGNTRMQLYKKMTDFILENL